MTRWASKTASLVAPVRDGLRGVAPHCVYDENTPLNLAVDVGVYTSTQRPVYAFQPDHV